jgi:hypothetical protein
VQFTGTVVKLLAVPLVAMEGYSPKFIISTGFTPSTRDANVFAIGKYLRAPI